MTIKLGCPSCGAEVVFKSQASVFSVCSFCKSMLVRRDINLETLGKMAELPSDLSPLKIGAGGKFETKSFEILGRIKISWEDGQWNEWYVLFVDGTAGWLSEAQGFFAMSFESTGRTNLPPRDTLKPGALIKLQSTQEFQIDDIKRVTYVGSEGELPFTAPCGQKNLSVDLSAPNGLFGTLEYFDGSTARLYLGRYVQLDDLHLTGLRTFDGW